MYNKDSDNKNNEPRRQFGYGRVIQVHSGDSFTVVGGVVDAKVNPIPPTQEIAISSIQAPLCVRNRTGVDEPYGWESREFLRRLIFGKQIKFDIKVQTPGARVFADVSFDRGNGPENLSELIILKGWAKLKESKNTNADQFPERQNLLKLQGKAEEEARGIWTKKDKPEKHVREVEWGYSLMLSTMNSREERNRGAEEEFDWAFKNKGKELPGVVQKVRDGSTFRCELTGLYPDHPMKHKILLVYLTGVSCAKVPPPIEVQRGMKSRNPSYEIVEQPPPFAEEAQQYSEERLLHRDVHVLIDGADKLGNVYGTLKYPKGNISLKLLEKGYAKLLTWSSGFSPDESKLVEAASIAEKKKLRIWALPEQESPKKQWEAKMTEVLSGDAFRFDGEEKKRWALASIRCPRIRRGEEPDKFFFEAREFVRSRLFGKKVKVTWAYTRFNQDFLNVSYVSQYQNKELDISEELVADGFAEVIIHQTLETRAPNYGKLIELERRAKRQQRHKWGEKNPYLTVFDFTNRAVERPKNETESIPTAVGNQAKRKGLSRSEISVRSATLLKQLKGDRQFPVVVEYCHSGARFKVFLQGVTQYGYFLNFVLAGVNCNFPRPRGSTQPDKWGMKAWSYAREKLLQQGNIRIGKIEMKDKGDNFLGRLYFGKKDWGLELIKLGYAQVRYDNEGSMWTAQEKAKKDKRGLWKDFVEPEPQVFPRDDQQEAIVTRKMESKVIDVEVTEIMDSTTFFVREVGADDYNKVAAAMENFEPQKDENFPGEKPNGLVCAGQFSDDLWYRIRIGSRTKTHTYRVQFIDFGNSAELEKSRLCRLPEELEKIPATCRACVLAGVKAPSASSAYVDNAAEAFNHYAFGTELSAKIEMEERSNKWHLTLTPKNSDTSINSLLIREGWARVLDRPLPKLKSYCQKLKSDEMIAKNSRKNIWEYGDVSDDDDEDEGRGETGRPPRISSNRMK